MEKCVQSHDRMALCDGANFQVDPGPKQLQPGQAAEETEEGGQLRQAADVCPVQELLRLPGGRLGLFGCRLHLRDLAQGKKNRGQKRCSNYFCFKKPGAQTWCLIMFLGETALFAAINEIRKLESLTPFKISFLASLFPPLLDESRAKKILRA